MKLKTLLLPVCLIASLAGCAKPVPQEKSAYVGEWQ